MCSATHGADRRDRAADQGRDTQRGYAFGPQGTAAGAAAACAFDHAGIVVVAAVLSGKSCAVLDTERVVIDEVHAFATGKRGDLLALSLARLQALAPQARRAALSATVADPDGFRGWLAPGVSLTAWSLCRARRARSLKCRFSCPKRSACPGPAMPRPGRSRSFMMRSGATAHADIHQHAVPCRADLPAVVASK